VAAYIQLRFQELRLNNFIIEDTQLRAVHKELLERMKFEES